MRVLRVIPSMDPALGGPCQGIRNSIPALATLGCENEVVCFDDPRSEFLKLDSFVVHALGNASSGWKRNAKLTPWLMENLVAYDAVIIHGLWLYHSYATTKVIQRLKKKLNHSKVPRCFVMPHGMLDPWFQRDKTRRLKAWRNWFYWKVVEHRVVSEADGVLFTCEQEMKLAREPFRPYRPKRELNVGYGIEEPPSYTDAMREAFQLTCPGLGDRPYLLFLSRIHPKKGVDLLLKAYAQISAKYHGQAAMPALVIAGPTNTSYAYQMQQLALELKLLNLQDPTNDESQSSQVHFPGMLQGDAKWGAFYGCDAFVLPSHQENFGIAVVEALACGKPVLISDQVNIFQEVVRDRAGMVCIASHTGVTQILNDWVLNNDQIKPQMRTSARGCFNERFQTSKAAISLHDILAVNIT